MSERAKFGTLLGVGPGNVEVYSSDYKTADDALYPTRESYRSYIDETFIGYKWQCVELARRWLYVNKGYVFDDVAMAYDIFNLHRVRKVDGSGFLPLKSFRNGAQRPPEPGCLLIWDEGGEFHETGHVAVVTEIINDHVRFIEQNVEDSVWPQGQTFSRELKLTRDKDGGHWLSCSFDDATIMGWVIQTDDATHAEVDLSRDTEQFNIQMKELKDARPNTHDWLDTDQPDLATYVKDMNGCRLSSNDANFYKYFCITETAHKELNRATRELHAMFMHATQYVLNNEDILKKFNLPEVLWSRIHNSWDNRRNEIVTGRMDFSLSERGIKIYEYNADSASCHLETGKIQQLWADAFGCDEGCSGGEEMFPNLVKAWKDTGVGHDLLHIMRDQDLEETYHAYYMQSALKAAGIESKIIKGLEGLHWDDNNTVVDADGVPITWVWKTWAWETALDEIREECQQEDDNARLSTIIERTRSQPRLVDVLLNKNVMVFEPLWTLIPSNKAILPVLWTLYPHHPYLLESHFELNDSLRQSGYVTKPIVGRCGANIGIFDANDKMLKETGGQFEDRDQIYQELFPLPEVGGMNIQIGTFTANGRYAGACVRADKSLIITSRSDLYPLRVCSDTEGEVSLVKA
ncbi:MAG: bifunctional glutathionylspermidine amidase/synthase [Methylocystaceae bacterium]|nr:bifunctional glutathionylspermidine amidase/synthase [Methylocystaceae bacterium]